MNGKDHLKETLEYYRQQRARKIEELRPIDLMIRNLERELGENPTNPVDLYDSATPQVSEVLDNLQTVSGTQPSIRPDEFYQMSQTEAAKVYLRKVGRAIGFDQLVEALRKGGATLGGADPKKTLYVSLARNPRREFVYPSDGFIGLSEFYQDRGKPMSLRKVKKGGKKKTKSAKRKRAVKAANGKKEKIAAVTTSIPKAEKETAHVNVGEVVREVMRDGKPRTREDIFKAVETKLGHPIAPIAVYGTLRGKGFSADDDGKISLVQ
jgi:hypothetical protein